jgi:serine/threonine-protein kinase RsbW
MARIIMGQIKKDKKTYQLKIPSDTANLEIIRDFVSGIARNLGFNVEDINRIELAVDEASTNVIKHAYKGNNLNKKTIFIKVITYPNKIEICVADKGTGFDPKKIQTPNMENYLKKMKRGGLGMFLIKTLMDKVEYHINPGVHNRVKMIKYT